jgi:hypothetical protein
MLRWVSQLSSQFSTDGIFVSCPFAIQSVKHTVVTSQHLTVSSISSLGAVPTTIGPDMQYSCVTKRSSTNVLGLFGTNGTRGVKTCTAHNKRSKRPSIYASRSCDSHSSDPNGVGPSHFVCRVLICAVMRDYNALFMVASCRSLPII